MFARKEVQSTGSNVRDARPSGWSGGRRNALWSPPAQVDQESFEAAGPAEAGVFGVRASKMKSETNRSLVDQYHLDVALGEIDALERTSRGMPHIERLLRTEFVNFLLQHLQNFIWTVLRTHAKVAARAKAISARDACPRRSCRPALASIQYNESILRERPRFLLDVTHTSRSGIGGGIARVCRELARAGVETGLAIPVVLHDGGLFPYYAHASWDHPIEVSSGDHYIIIDTFWDPICEYTERIEFVKKAGAKVSFLVHDVIPLEFPAFCSPSFAPLFERTLREMWRASNFCLSVSEATAAGLKEELSLSDQDAARIASFHLGVRFSSHGHLHTPPILKDIVARAPTFLSVGTLEPKKGFALALDAFDRLWTSGIEAQYMIIGGRPGWASRALEERIALHPQKDRKLFWIRDASDEDLQYAYRNAYCVIQPSVNEGFGLPLVEAAYFGVAAIVSDIPVFREIAGDQPVYFAVCDSADLANKIGDALKQRPICTAIPYNSWHQSLSQMIDALIHLETL